MRAWRWIALASATIGWWVAQPAQAQATDRAYCPEIRQPEKTVVKYNLLFDQRHADFVKVQQVTSVEISERQWDFANALTLSADSSEHRDAMQCLLREGRKSKKKFNQWHPEWQSISSQATKEKDLVTLRYESWNLISSPGEFEVGPWTVMVGRGKDWEAVLRSPDALKGASRKTVEVKSGGLEISGAPGASSASKASRVWAMNGSSAEVKIVPPRNLSSVLSRRDSWIESLGVVSWWICSSAVIALSVWPFLEKKAVGSDKKAVGNPKKAAARVLATTALQWAGLSAALGLTLLLVLQPSPGANRWRALVGITSGLALVLLARPWLPLSQASGGSQNGLKRRIVVVAASAAAAIGLLVIVAPQLFGLPSNLMPAAQPPLPGIVGLVLLDMSVLWLWFTAMAAWGWRFAREGRLGKPSIGNEPGHHLRNIMVIGAVLAVAAAMVVVCYALSFELRWERANWIGGASALFDNTRGSALSQQLAELSSVGPLWAYAHTWVLTGVALVALLHISSRLKPQKNSLGPKGWDLLLVTAVFAIVTLRGVKFAGSSSEVYGLWLPLNMVALYAMVKAGRRWSVLGRMDREVKKCMAEEAVEKESYVAAELGTRAGHRRLMDESRRCRDLLHRLHLVDQGRAEGVTRRDLEEQLSALHHWRPTKCSRDCLPDPVSVVDVALSWGPRRRWWKNAIKAARWAAIFGIVPSMVTAWYENAYDIEHWTFTLDAPTGIPDMLWEFARQEIFFAGAGLVLGALWRVLPGERGPVRAFNLFIAWLVPIAVLAMLNHSIDRKALGLAVLNVVLMLMVLTLTSMWMDTETFSRERPYWTKRLGLLASVYQVHGLSGQLAFLVVQVAAAVTIWRQIVTA